MKKSAVAAAVAVLALGSLSGAAFAGDHHGDHGSKQSQKPGSAQPMTTTTSSDQQAGQKPDNTTDHNTSCTTGGGQGASATCQSTTSSKSDASKQYGNGETAAQIANGKGAPSGTTVTGPGNSQPHKICGRDVHAYKGGDCSQEQEQPKPQEQQVTFCDMSSATSGDLETKDASDVANHEFDGNPEENRDIVPPFTLNGKTYSENWDANGQAIFNAGCNGSSGVQSTTTTTVATTTTVQNENEHGKVYVCHATASATNPYVLIHISVNGWTHGHSHHQDGRDVFLGDKPGPCPTAGQVQGTTTTMNTTTTVPTTTTTTTTSASTTTTAAAAAVSPASNTTPPSSTGGVKGASHTIAAPASAAKPSSGVLGAAKTLGRTATSGTLPFTGLRLWIVELIALGLIGAGVAMRLIARRRMN